MKQQSKAYWDCLPYCRVNQWCKWSNTHWKLEIFDKEISLFPRIECQYLEENNNNLTNSNYGILTFEFWDNFISLILWHTILDRILDSNFYTNCFLNSNSSIIADITTNYPSIPRYLFLFLNFKFLIKFFRRSKIF